MSEDHRERLLEASEVAEQLAVPMSWVYAAARTGRFPCVRMGRYVRFRQADVDELVWSQSPREM